MTNDFKPVDEPGRCMSVHWHLPTQCTLPSTHRENWHETIHPGNGNPIRYNYTSSRTEEMRHGVWHNLVIPKPVPAAEAELRARIADAIGRLKLDYRSMKEFTALDHAERIARGPLLEQGAIRLELCEECLTDAEL
jgi:hypothetical protein